LEVAAWPLLLTPNFFASGFPLSIRIGNSFAVIPAYFGLIHRVISYNQVFTINATKSAREGVKNMKKLSVVLLLLALSALCFAADEDDNPAADRVHAAATVLEEIQATPDVGIPDEVMGSAECVAVVPSMLKGGFMFGAQYGRGVASCRTPKGWSDPAFFTIKGGSFGLQIGGQAVDLVMLIMNHKGMDSLLSSKFKLGADATVAAGPVGRHAAADTDWKMRAQVLSYSRARGVFAGLELNGAVVSQDRESTRIFYGKMEPFAASLQTVTSPQGALPFLNDLAKWAKIASK
jgi:lipid-binding SYLF domain-containing protein